MRWTSCVLICFGVCVPSSAQGPSDDFTGAALDSCRWNFVSSTRATSKIQNGLVLTSDGTLSYSSARTFSQYYLPGDFDAQIDYQLDASWNAAVIPAGQNPQMAGSMFGIYFDAQNYVMMMRNRTPGGADQVVVVGIGFARGLNVGVPISGLTGTFRIRRTGSQMEFLMLLNGSWSSIVSWGLEVRPGVFWLGSENVNAQNTVITTFRNFRLNSGNTNFQNYQLPAKLKIRPDFAPGFVSADSLAWTVWGSARTFSPFQMLASHGMGRARIRVTTKSVPALENTPFAKWGTLPWNNDYWASLQMATQELLQAQSLGMQNYLELFLSDTAADASRQDAPPEWKGLSVEETATKLEQYTFATVSYLRSKGIKIDLYSPGSEIETGILNFRPGDRLPAPVGAAPTEAMDFMEKTIWPTEATLLKAAIAGIRRADPEAKIVLPIAGLISAPANLFTQAFVKTMVNQGVPFDVVGLSLPYMVDASTWDLPKYSTTCWYQRLDAAYRGFAELGKKGIIAETSYPNSTFNLTNDAPLPDFPLTPNGQAAWVNSALRFASNNPNVIGLTYFYPEFYPGVNGSAPPNLESASLFVNATQVQPGLLEFDPFLKARAAPKISAVVKLSNSQPGSFSPGEYAVVYGENLAIATVPAVQAPYAPTLANVSVTVNGRPAAVQYVSQGQVNFLIPYAAAVGSATVVLTVAAQSSDPAVVQIQPVAPDILVYNGNQAIAQNFPSYALNGPSTPAPPGSAVIVYVEGLGSTSPAIADGNLAPSNPPARPTQTVTATIGGQNAAVLFAGMTPQLVGLGQVNITLPVGLTPGSYPLVISVGNQASKMVSLSVGGR